MERFVYWLGGVWRGERPRTMLRLNLAGICIWMALFVASAALTRPQWVFLGLAAASAIAAELMHSRMRSRGL